MNRKYKNISCGGTFDFLHIGHRKFLEAAFSISNFVTIGVVSDNFSKKLGKKCYHNFEARRESLSSFLTENDYTSRSKIIKLEDVLGNTISDRNTEAILVSSDTYKNADSINRLRIANNLTKLKVVKVDDVVIDKIKVSSSLIKSGIIDSEGFNFHKYLISNNFTLTGNLRPILSRVWGTLSEIPAKTDVNVITVGDQTTYDFYKNGVSPFLSIFDLKIQRVEVFLKSSDLGVPKRLKVIKVLNNPGLISSELSKAISKTYLQRVKKGILVDGEDDLAAIPAVLLAPIPSKVFYGLRGEGLIRVDVDLNTKKTFLGILKKFDIRLA